MKQADQCLITKQARSLTLGLMGCDLLKRLLTKIRKKKLNF